MCKRCLTLSRATCPVSVLRRPLGGGRPRGHYEIVGIRIEGHTDTPDDVVHILAVH